MLVRVERPINAEGMAERLAFRWGKISEDF
jgi:hypothetical protein